MKELEIKIYKIGHDDLLLVTNFIYGSVARGSIMRCDEGQKTINNIVKVSEKFNSCIICNDSHNSEDSEFRYLPKHAMAMTAAGTPLLETNVVRSNCRSTTVLNKNVLSCVKSDHNKRIILDDRYKSVYVAGFCGCMDILATCFDLMQEGKDVHLLSDCMSDLTEELKDRAIKTLAWIGVKVHESSSLL